MGVDDNFSELKRELTDLQSRQASLADRTAETLAKEMRKFVVDYLKSQTTIKGGTYNSDSSPYDPGGENDSTNSSTHLTDGGDNGAWRVKKSGTGGQGGSIKYSFTPIPSVSDRAYYILNGTNDKEEPDGDYPMHFFYQGNHIILSEAPPDASPEERWNSEPVTRDGLNSLDYISNGIIYVNAISRNKAKEELNKTIKDSRGELLSFKRD